MDSSKNHFSYRYRFPLQAQQPAQHRNHIRQQTQHQPRQQAKRCCRHQWVIFYVTFLLVVCFHFYFKLLIISTTSNVANLNTLPDTTSSSFVLDRKQQRDGGAFIHIGKTAGSTISILLRNGCHSYMKHPCRMIIPKEYESKASLLIHSYYHVPDFHRLKNSNHSFYMLTLRDPYERTVSSFVYDHILNRIARDELQNFTTTILNPAAATTTTTAPPKRIKTKQKKLKDFYKKLYDGYMVCFPFLENFVQYLGSNSDNDYYYDHPKVVNATSCTNLARGAIHGKVRVYHHLFFNYEKIYHLLPHANNITLYVLRQQRLWEDWITINRDCFHQTTPIWTPSLSSSIQPQPQQQQLFSNSDNNNDDFDMNDKITNLLDAKFNSNRRNISKLEEAKNHTLEVVTRNVSAIGRSYLCYALQKEYQYYFWFIEHAQNTLHQSHIDEAISVAKKSCPMLHFPMTIPL